jgi:hypothetical protein
MQLAVAANAYVNKISSFTCAMIWSAIFLAGASVGDALALEEGRALEFKILDNLCRCFLLRIQQAGVTENEERHDDETKSLTHDDSLSWAALLFSRSISDQLTPIGAFSHKYALCSIKHYRLRFWPVGRVTHSPETC